MDKKTLKAKPTERGCPRKTYSREFLLRLCTCDAAKRRPIGLPLYPQFILDEPVFVDIDFQRKREYCNEYVWNSKSKLQIPPQTGIEDHEKKQLQIEEQKVKKKRKGKQTKTQKLEIQQQDFAAEDVSPISNIARQETTAQSEDCRTINSRKTATSQFNEADTSSIREETFGTTATFKSTIANLLDGQIKRTDAKRLHQTGHLDDKAKKNSYVRPMEQASMSRTRDPDIKSESHVQLHKHDNGETTEEAKVCDPCAYTNETKEAVNYCIQCEDFLCDICSSSHRKSKLSRTHELLANDAMPTEKVMSAMPNDGICAKHKGELLRFYCKKHRDFVCPICVVSHKRCKVELIEEIATCFDESEEYKTVIAKLRGSVLLLSEQGQTSLINADIVQSAENRLISEIRKFRSHVDIRFDAMERDAIMKVRDVCQKEIEILKNVSNTCLEKEREINEMDDNLKRLEEFQQKQPLVVATKQVLERIGSLESVVEDLCRASPMKSFGFKTNIKLVEAVSSCQSFGDIVAEIGSDVLVSKENST